MNTKTMRLPPRRVLTSNNKRKDREGFDTLKPFPPQQPQNQPTKVPKPNIGPQDISSAKQPNPASLSSNQLLAGYLAHEFLSQGTLFGQPWDPAGAESAAGLIKPSEKGKEAKPSKYQRYVEVSGLLKGEEGAHIPGVFNPSQLARFLHM